MVLGQAQSAIRDGDQRPAEPSCDRFYRLAFLFGAGGPVAMASCCWSGQRRAVAGSVVRAVIGNGLGGTIATCKCQHRR